MLTRKGEDKSISVGKSKHATSSGSVLNSNLASVLNKIEIRPRITSLGLNSSSL